MTKGRRTKNKKKKNKKLILYISSLLLLLVLSAAASYKLALNSYNKEQLATKIDNTKTSNNKDKLNTVSEKTLPPKVEEKKPKETIVTISNAGDCTLGTDEKFAFACSMPDVVQKNNNDLSYLFKNVKSIFSEDDLTVVNLETTFTNATKKAQKQFTFKAPPEYAKALPLASIEAVNIANNHIYDYLDQGFKDTKEALKSESVIYFGEGEKWSTVIKDKKFGFLGYRGFSYDHNSLASLKNDIQTFKNQGCIVIINFHWGDEGSFTPNNTQKYLAHYAIDNGADLIIGHHPHVIQGIEKYKDKIIAYSLSNFCFGGNFNPTDKDTFILQVQYKFIDDKLTSYGVRAIPCSISSVNNINDYCPTPLNNDAAARVLNKLNRFSPGNSFEISETFTFIDAENAKGTEKWWGSLEYENFIFFNFFMAKVLI